jgi:hypothetical protein
MEILQMIIEYPACMVFPNDGGVFYPILIDKYATYYDRSICARKRKQPVFSLSVSDIGIGNIRGLHLNMTKKNMRVSMGNEERKRNRETKVNHVIAEEKKKRCSVSAWPFSCLGNMRRNNVLHALRFLRNQETVAYT